MHGICHIEIPTTDPKKSQEFYSKLFNWKMNQETGGYISFVTPDNDGGGFTTQSKPVEAGVVLYIKVEDIQQKLGEIKSSAGRVIKEKTKISEEFGYYALFVDPCGNIMGLWSKN